ncbi:MAG: NifB/NifX family molybdenum-iron cluster-binding protein [bacterium]|nr:NifB/NifX family molybdenum-iron cluster-binding protein [bacterium]
MLVCIPTSDGTGLDARIHEHFGSAPYFTLYDTKTEKTDTIENRNSHHSHGTCHPMTQLAKYKIEAVICTGMGRRAVEALNSEGIRTLTVATDSARAAVNLLSEGNVSDIDAAKACHGHGQHQDQADPSPGRGRGLGLGSGKSLGSGTGGRRGLGRGTGSGHGSGRGGR